MKAVIFLAHGSRLTEANKTFCELAEKVAAELNLRIFEVAFFEQASPPLGRAIASCVDQGASCILIYPHFLSSGIHLTRDLPDEIELAKSSHPEVDIKCILSLGEHPALFDFVSRIVEDGLR